MKTSLTPDYTISKVIKGGWQLSAGHDLTGRALTEAQALRDMDAFFEAGITTLDFGDIYTGVEALVGRFVQDLRARYGSAVRDQIQLHTKYVPDRALLAQHTPEHVREIVQRSQARLGVEKIDLVQFHWWDYGTPGYLEALETLFQLKTEGAIREVGVTNFDTVHLHEFVQAGLKPLSTQVQFSLLDRRPKTQLQAYCVEHGIHLLCYGTVAGGLLSERYLGQSPQEDETRSHTKYRLIVEEFGGWNLFQELLQVLHSTALKHETDIATVASAWVLAQSGVAGVIVGARNTDHLAHNLQIAALGLDEQARSEIDRVLARAKPPRGDVYGLEREDVRHAGIMRTNLNAR